MRFGFLAPSPYPLAPVLLGALVLLCAAAAPARAQDAEPLERRSQVAEDRPVPRRPHRRRSRRARASPTSSTSASTTAASGRPPTTAASGRPIFDDQPTGSIGAIAVAPSDPNVIYVGSGEGLQRPDLSVGDGIYKSTDAGRTWTHLGLRDGQQIAQILVDPRDAEPRLRRRPRPPVRPQRGARRLPLDRRRRDVEEGALPGREHRRDGPGLRPRERRHRVRGAVGGAAGAVGGERRLVTLSANNGLYRSTDGGATWARFGTGLPDGRGSRGPHRPRRVGRASRGGCTPSRPTARSRGSTGATTAAPTGGSSTATRACGSGTATSAKSRWTRRTPTSSTSATSRRGRAPTAARTSSASRARRAATTRTGCGSTPNDPRMMLLAGDQGACVSVNGGDTWSSWYNQPTAQFYHVITDNQFPYRVYGGQQESGSAWVLSRGNDGQITFGDWHPVGAQEYGYVAPDPLHPNIVLRRQGDPVRHGDGRRAGRWRRSAPRGPTWRFVRTAPLLFSPVDPRILYYAGNVVFKTLNGGSTWQVISPDLTRAHYDMPASTGAFTSLDPEKGAHRGVVYTIAPSFRRVNLLWAGTDDGLIWVTHNGGVKWTDVTPPALTPWSKVSLMEASHADTLEAYAAVNRIRLDDLCAARLSHCMRCNTLPEMARSVNLKCFFSLRWLRHFRGKLCQLWGRSVLDVHYGTPPCGNPLFSPSKKPRQIRVGRASVFGMQRNSS